MIPQIAVGSENFVSLRNNNSYYVDKTEILYELVESNNAVTLFTRPRRFGKTLMVSMMESFFDIGRQDGHELFDGLAVMEHPDFCEKYMNQYPVLLVSLKDVEGLNFESALGMLRIILSNLCIKLDWLLRKESVDSLDKEIFQKLKAQQGTIEDLKNALKTIMRMMTVVFGKPVILLMDEYDVPLAKAQENGYYREMLDLIRGIMSISLKTNEYLKFAVITGCLRIPKESIFTVVNNFTSYSVLDEDFSGYFGFTQDEVSRMLTIFDCEDQASTIKDWYDGYLFGNTEVYCPWDVVNYISALRKRKNAAPKNYWEHTSGNGAIQAFFEMDNTDISDSFETLMNGESISASVTNSLTYDEAYQNESNLWSILLMTGYVTLVHMPEDRTEETGNQDVELRIPNKEIAGIFQKAVVDHFNKTVDSEKLQNLMSALWEGNEGSASEILTDLLWHTISYMDYHEDYYHAFLAGIFVGRGKYSIKTNNERGLGRPDIDLRDKKNRRAIIIEAKKSDSEGRMNYWCEEAIKQIKDKQYADNLDGYNQVMCYGISFYKKKALVKKFQKIEQMK